MRANHSQMTLDPALRQIVSAFRNSKAWDEELDLCLLRVLWPRVAGPSLALDTEVVGFRDNLVTIRVPDETWGQQLRSVRFAMIRKLNQSWPGSSIREIRFIHEDHTR